MLKKNLFSKYTQIFFLIGCAFFCIVLSHQILLKYESEFKASETPLYLPQAEWIKPLSFGYTNSLAHFIWFQTLNYVGREFRGNQDYRFLRVRCELVLKLNPKSNITTEFCGNLLSWNAHQPEQSYAIYSDAIKRDPEYWRWRYLRGFTSWYFLDDIQSASNDLEEASRLPNAPKFLADLAARLLTTHRSPQAALKFLEELIQKTPQGSVQESLLVEYKRANLAVLNQKLNELKTQFGSKSRKSLTTISDLESLGVPLEKLKDPFGGTILWDEKTKEFRSSTGERPLKFHMSKAKI